MVKRWVIVLVTVLLAAVGCTLPVDLNLGSTGVRDVDFSSYTFPPDSCGHVFASPPADGYQLVDGGVRHGTPLDADFYSVTLHTERSYGDITGNGDDEVVLLLDCSTGNHPRTYGWAYTAAGATTRALGVLPPPPEPDGIAYIELATATIDHGIVVAQWQLYHDGDGHCCPSASTTVNYRWIDDRFAPN